MRNEDRLLSRPTMLSFDLHEAVPTSNPGHLRRPMRLRELDPIVESRLPSLVSVARRILGSDDLAWDTVQDALWRLHQESVMPENPIGWLRRSILRRSFRKVEQRKRREAHEAASHHEPVAIDPARQASMRELGLSIDAAIRDLGPKEREVIELREQCGLDYAAIAGALGVPLGTVRSRLNRARLLLRRALGEELVAEFDGGAMLQTSS